jgi:hypothetical protein
MMFSVWRKIHLGASATVVVVAVAHVALTPVFYHQWTPDTVWFAGLGILLLGISNWTHLGVEPCHQPTAPLVRWANVVFAGFGAAAVIAVPQPQAYILLAALVVQAIAGQATLRGPG